LFVHVSCGTRSVCVDFFSIFNLLHVLTSNSKLYMIKMQNWDLSRSEITLKAL
jgi:hypothetical protein